MTDEGRFYSCSPSLGLNSKGGGGGGGGGGGSMGQTPAG